MKKAPSVTRTEALKIARYLGCEGAHETDSGWMPCADHATLTRISQRAEKSLASDKKGKRRRRGVRSAQWEELNERPVVSIDTLPGGGIVSGVIGAKAAKQECPPATKSVSVNLRNRQKAIKEADYGPLNPNESNSKYWSKLASEWRVDEADAKKQRCGNCAAFIKTPEMLSCIKAGIGSDKDAWSVVEAGDLGFCEFFDFKCASKRTCSAWVVGGPVTETKSLSERRVRLSDPDVFSSPESARVRSRQLGCIGIRRYSTNDGDSAWMPCTNESDYRRSMGTSPQGRMDIAKNQMRQMRLAIGKMKQKSLGAKTPAPPKDRIVGSKRNAVGTARTISSAAKIELSTATVTGLKRSLAAHNKRMEELNKPSWTRANLDSLKAVYQRGAGAYSTSHRPNVTRGQWAMGRVRAFLWMLEHGKPKKLSYIGDSDLLPQKHPFRLKQKSIDTLLPQSMFEELERKGLGKWFGRARRAASPKGGGRGFRRRIEKPKFDGDNDNMITNPLTGVDEIPWQKDRETPDEAIKRFFGGRMPAQGASTAATIGEMSNQGRRRTILGSILGGRKRKKPKPGIRLSQSPVGGSKEPKYPKLIDDPGGRGAWRRDDDAVRLGDDWISGRNADLIEPVPKVTNIPLRRWNGLTTQAQSRLAKGKTGRTQPSSEAWQAMLQQAVIDGLAPAGVLDRLKELTGDWWDMAPDERADYDARRRLDDPKYMNPEEILKRIRSAGAPTAMDDDIDIVALMGELDAGDGGRQDPFTLLSKMLSSRTAFQYGIWQYKRDQRRKNPSGMLENGPILDDFELWGYVSDVAAGVNRAIEKAKGERGFSPIDGVPESRLVDFLEEELEAIRPAIASLDDEEMARRIAYELFGLEADGPLDELVMDGESLGYDMEAELDAYRRGFNPNMLPDEFSPAGQLDPERRNPYWFDNSGLSMADRPPEMDDHDPKAPGYRPYATPEIDDLMLDDIEDSLMDDGPDVDPSARGRSVAVSGLINSLISTGVEREYGDLEDLLEIYGDDQMGSLRSAMTDVEQWLSDVVRQMIDIQGDPIASMTLPEGAEEILLYLGVDNMPEALKRLGLDRAFGGTRLDSSVLGPGMGLYLTLLFIQARSAYMNGSWDPAAGNFKLT